MERAVAPYFRKIAPGPEHVESRWVMARDGIRLRIAVWTEGEKGTVMLFPGRTDFIEKYAPAAAELQTKGFASAAIDWRGQGLADRPLADRNTGHVSRFTEYQLDVAAMMDALGDFSLPQPFFLLAHSMGGCIGLRALFEGLDVEAAVFSAPMWGIEIHPIVRPVAQPLAWAATTFRLGHIYAPGTDSWDYAQKTPFEGNLLTTDPEMYAFIRGLLAEYPDLSLGGPSLQWVHEALEECRILSRRPSPNIPALTFLGSDDHVVDHGPIRRRMANWPGSRLQTIPDARHEPMMETPPIRATFFGNAVRHFKAHSRRNES